MSSRAEQKAKAREARIAAERAAEQVATRRRRLITFGAILAVAAIAVVVAVVVGQSGGEEDAAPAERLALYDGIPQDGTLLGDPDAPVVVEEYADLQCPFCADFSETNLEPIIRDFVRPGDVQLDLKLLTFLGADSVEGARAATAAGLQDREWQFVDLFYANQGQENSGYVTEEFLRDIAGRVPGLDADRMLADADSAAVLEELDEAERSAAEAGVDSTPTFRVGPRGGEMRTVTGDELPQAISDALEQARQGT